ncbi:hypothetical protein T4D_14397 [Trichinella pseudospiralis]|uniref:Uncharacterized protein n=1 Tax=Trichinella pseudospiralis TaxID=6337 RepID=A0A0V1G2L1_TRIPS|nr:hypothetical protein T4D_14397 [Trichinella pseudospiralis]
MEVQCKAVSTYEVPYHNSSDNKLTKLGGAFVELLLDRSAQQPTPEETKRRSSQRSVIETKTIAPGAISVNRTNWLHAAIKNAHASATTVILNWILRKFKFFHFPSLISHQQSNIDLYSGPTFLSFHIVFS